MAKSGTLIFVNLLLQFLDLVSDFGYFVHQLIESVAEAIGADDEHCDDGYAINVDSVHSVTSQVLKVT